MVKQIHSMQAIQKHGPQIKEIQKKYKGDRQKMNEEVMAFYKENHINPAASCLPMLIQLPVFFALYLTLKHYSHHIQGSWLHVVPNIADKPTTHWSGYLLVAIYIGSQVASTFFMGAQMDKMQRNIFLLLPLIMITVVAALPDRAAHVLDDDEPLDGRPGPRHPQARAAHAGPGDAELRVGVRHPRRQPPRRRSRLQPRQRRSRSPRPPRRSSRAA